MKTTQTGDRIDDNTEILVLKDRDIKRMFFREFGNPARVARCFSKEDIEIFTKKAIYLYLRELTGLNTKQVVNSLNKFREKYSTFKQGWLDE